MRLRQVALASSRLDELVKAFAEVFGLKVAYEDPNVGVYGLRNAVLPAGTGFLEIVEPVRDDASAARFLKRRGGDAGYMVILQVADAEAERARAVAMGVRVVDDIDRPYYRCSHFHPADFGGILASFDQQRTESDHLAPYGEWMPAGSDWRRARTDDVVDLASVTISAADPGALARRWSELLARPLDPTDPLRIPLDHGEVRFARAAADAATCVTGVDLKVRDVAQVMRSAEAARLDVSGDGVLIGGVRFRPVA
ncbi:MAG TPA: VOC family protein [Quisquiliibacterium sp.]|nr:VOC family protein [Quisquiliibacterium sp.]